jgi:osmoprotectant transport system permease protein
VAISIPVSVAISVPLGFFVSSRPRLARIVIYIAGVLMTIPSLALFGVMVVLLAPVGLGLGAVPAIIAITLYSLLPITRNTYTALNQVSHGMTEAATGLGMSAKQVMWKVKIPLSVPVIMAGVRNAVVLGVSVATFASLVGAGGLGYFIFSGISRANLMMVLIGAIVVSALGVGVNAFLIKVEDWITPKGLKVTRE